MIAELSPTPEEQAHRDGVISTILDAIRTNRTILLPEFDRQRHRPEDAFALLHVGIEPNPYGGTVGPFRYQFEGEEDLLHMIITRANDGPVSPAEGQAVCSFLYPGVPTALMWFKPGEMSQHFYLGHDVLLEYL